METDPRRQLSIDIKAEITSSGTTAEIANVHEPVIRQNSWKSVVLIPVRKATTIFTSDSLDSTGSMLVVVTATPIP